MIGSYYGLPLVPVQWQCGGVEVTTGEVGRSQTEVGRFGDWRCGGRDRPSNVAEMTIAEKRTQAGAKQAR